MFENLDVNMVVQQLKKESALPETMGLMIPYSIQPITKNIWNYIHTIEVVTEVMGTVLLLNFVPVNFFSLTGIPLISEIANENESINLGNLFSAARVKEWLIKGLMPKAEKYEALIEHHYGPFYSLKPEKNYKHRQYHFYIRWNCIYSVR